MTTVAVDAMGSDQGPGAVVAGAAAATLEAVGPEVLLIGDEALLRRQLLVRRHDPARVRLVHAPAFVSSAEKASECRRVPGASIRVAAQAVRSGEADVLVSAGHTGAVTLCCAEVFERLPGVRRCALGAVYPTERVRGARRDPFALILDVGLTLDASAQDLCGFALMGAAYASRITRVARPAVALLSNGAESNRGTRAVVDAHRRLAACEALDFIGNIEGTDIPLGRADVVVTSGFTGNIVLKMLEGVADTVLRLARYAGDKNFRYRAGLGLLAPAVKRLRLATDWEQYGGAPILGFDRLCIKAHGRSSPRAIRNAIKLAARAARSDVVGAIGTGLAQAPPLLFRGAPL